MTEFYVYVYIDPRNFEEFYYGKGKGNRKNAHMLETSDSEKVKRIKAINKEGLEPIIKVIARNLTENEALLVEKTLIWKLGKSLTNISSGHFADKFRPHNKFHLNLSGFDYKNGIYYVNVGEGDTRNWDDCKKYGFISAGQDKKWSDPLRSLHKGDLIVAYLKRHGYIGIGKVMEEAVKINDFRINNKTLREFPLVVPNMFMNSENEKSEFLLKVDWIEALDRKEAKWKRKSNLFTTQQIRASLDNQAHTLRFIESEFGISFRDYLQ